MKRSDLSLSVNQTVVTEGDIVTLQWSAPDGAAVQLSIDNGYKNAIQDVSPTGSKQFRLNRSRRYTTFSITASLNGKSASRRVAVRVKPPKVQRAEVINDPYQSAPDASNHIPVKMRWEMTKAAFQRSWNNMPTQKQVATVALSIASLSLLFYGLSYTKLAIFLWIVLMVYLLRIALKS